jgi:TP901 family phage tail tape measure protein
LADVNSNININFNTADALAELRRLQAGLSRFHQQLAEGNLAAANAQKGLNAQLVQAIGATGKFAVSQGKVASSTMAFTTALEKNKLSLKEYYRYSMAAATANTRTLSKAFSQEREIINRARRDRVKALQAQYIQMAKAQGGFIDAMRVMPRQLAMANGQFTELGTRIQYAAQRQQFLNQLLKQGSTQLLNFGKNTQWAGRQLMVGLTIPLTMLGGYASKAFRELEESIVKFRRVYGDAFTNDAEVDAAVENIRKLATEYTKFGVAVTETMEMAATAAAAGFKGTDLTRQVETATKLAVLGQVEQQQALETTISLQNAFGLSSDELAEKINFLNAVENQTVLSIEDLTIAIPKAAPVIKQLGGNVEDLAFFMTAMKEGGINASEGANALKSGLASLINPSEKAAKFLGGMGINLKGLVEANKGDIKGTVVGFARALDELDPLNRARAIEQLFGKFQFARLSTLFQNVSKDGTQAARAFQLTGASVEELAILSEREMKKIEESVGVKFQAALEQFKQDIMPLGKAFLEAVTPIVKFFGSLFEKFNGLSDQTKKVITAIVAVVAGIGPVVLMTFGLLANGLANLIKLFATIRGGIAKLNGQTNVLGAGFNYVTQEQLEQQAAGQALHNTHTRLVEIFNIEKTAAMQLASAYASLSSQMRSMAAQNPALFAGGVGGAKRAAAKLPPARKYKDGIISVPGPKGAGDVVPAMLSPGEAVIPTETTDKYRGLITAMFQDKVPGFMAGRLPGGPGRGIPLSAGPEAVRKAQQARNRRRDDARQGYDEPHPERQSGAVFVGMPKSAKEASQSREIVDKIAKNVKDGKYGDVAPTDFGTLLQPFSGRSFPVRGVGGVYRKPNGKIVVVKPTIDEKTALAEVRATQIAREVHGLVSPKQSIKTMIDPTDPSGQRKFIVIESPYDPRIAAMDGKFSQSDMVKQLVASTLRADKDLQKANLSGNVLADVGTAGVFDRASGFRDFSKGLPSMEQQALINLLGVKGGAKKFFAQETSGLAANMTPAQYDAAIKAEINKSIPRLERVLKSWDLTPDEQVVYNDMLKRLKDGAKTDWSQLQSVHARAGSGVVKALEGIDPGSTNSLAEEQLRKYLLPPGTQEKTLIEELKRTANNDFIRELDRVDPQRRAVIEAAWKGGVAAVPPSGREQNFTSPRQTQFMNELSKMHPVMVNGEVRYIHKQDLDAFLADPDGRAKYSRSAKQVTDMMLYRMGVIPNEKGRLVSGGKFQGRFASIEPFVTALRSTGKQAGGGKANISNIVKPFATKEIQEYNARIGNPLTTKTGRAMLAAGYTPDEVRGLLKENLSHIKQEVTGRQGALKMKTGEALYDARILNNYMNAKRRGLNILDIFNKDNVLGLSEIEKREYRKAAEFMARGSHPRNPQERMLLAKAAQLDQLVIDYQANGGKVAGKYLPADLRTPKMLLTLLSDPQFQPGNVMNLAAKSADEVLVAAKRGESLVNRDLTAKEKINSSNSSPMPKGTVGVDERGKRTSDNVVVRKGRGQAIATASQAARLRMLPGFEGGDSTLRGGGITNPTRRQGDIAVDLRRRGVSQSEIDKILRSLAKKEIRAKEVAVAASEKAARTEAAKQKEQAALQKRQTEAARKRFLENERRARLNAAQAKYYDDAVKEDQRRKLKQLKQTEKAERNQRKLVRQEKVNRFSGGASMALGTAGMGLMMAGQQTAGMVAMGASAVAGMAPMLAGMGPLGWAITGLTAAAGAFLLTDRAAKKAAESQSKYVDSISATTEKMAQIGQLTNTVGASEIYARKRQAGAADRYTTGFERGKQQFGETFIESEVGKSVFESFKQNMTTGGIDAVKAISVQLAAYVSDGVMTAEQAHSVASQIGIELNNTTLISQISGQLLDLIGPEGQDLTKDPLNVRMNLVQEQRSVSTGATKNLSKEIDKSLPSTEESVIERYKRLFNPKKAWEEAIKPIFTETDAEKSAAQIAALNANNLELNLAQQDSLSKQYDTEIKKLQAQKAATTDKAKQKKIDDEILTLEGRKQSGLDALRQKNKAILNDQIKAFRTASKNNQTKDAFLNSLNSQITTKYEGNPFAKTFLDKAKGLDSEEIEVKIKTVVAGGDLNPETGQRLIEIFGDDEKGLEKNLDIALTKHDPGAVTQLINSLGGVENDVAKKILVDVLKKNPQEFEKTASAIALVQKMAGKEVNIEAFFSSENALANLADLQKALEEVEKIDTPITKTALMEMKEIGGVNLDGLLPLWDQWENLPDETKKTIIQEYITVQKTITEGDVDAEIQRRIKAAGGARTISDYYATPAGREAARNALAGERTMQAVNQDIANAKAGKFKDDKKGGSKADPFADVMKRLKNVRNAALNAAGGFKELQKAIEAAGSKSVANKFVGIEQQLMNKGYSQDFIDFITQLDPEEQKKFGSTATKAGSKKYKEFDYKTGKMKTRTQKYKKGDFVLTDEGNAMRQGMDKAVVGEFQVEQQNVIKNIDEQNKAYAKLKAAGLSNLEIQKAMENQAYVTAIATGQITAQELKTNNALTKQAVLREQINGLVDKTKTNQTRIDALKKTPELINFLSAFKTLDAEGKEVALSITSIYDAIQDPEDLIAMVAVMDAIKAGTLDAKDGMKQLFDLIASSEASKDLEKNLLTPLEKFQKAYDAAMKIFDAYKQMDEYTLKAPKNSVTPELGGKTFKQLSRTKTESDEALAAMNAELAIYEHQISMIRDEIAKIESDIENMDVKDLNLTIDGQKVTGKLKYVLEDLKEKIDDWEREIEMKYERPIKTLQDESNVLSHDLEVMDYKAGKINEKYDKQAEALAEVQKVNESIIRQQEQQLDLADALTQGDISAAARAAQAMRAGNAADFATGQSDALQQSRENEINGLTNANGLTREQIEERRWQISQQIYALENDPARLALQKSIQETKDAIYAIEEAREVKLLAIRAHEERIYQIEKDKILPLQNAINLELTKNLALEYQLVVLGNIIAANDRNRIVAGQTRDQWEEMLAQMTLMDEKLRKELKDALDGFNAQSGTAEEIWKRIKDLYDSIKDKTVTVTVKYVTEGSPGDGSTGDGSTGDGSTGDGSTGDGSTGDGSTGNGSTGNGSTGNGSTGGSKSGSVVTGGVSGVNPATTPTPYKSTYKTITDPTAKAHVKSMEANISSNIAQNSTLFAQKIAEKKATENAGSVAGQHLADLNRMANAAALAKKYDGPEAAKKKAEAAQKAAADKAAAAKRAADLKKFGGNASAANSFANWGKSKNAGGLIQRFAVGGPVIGTDVIPSMLTPGEFVMSRYAVESFGLDNMKAINNGESVGDSVYNYSINVNVKSDANPDEIAQAVMTNIQRVNSQKLRSVRI